MGNLTLKVFGLDHLRSMSELKASLSPSGVSLVKLASMSWRYLTF
jgi:hypothetical protein